MLPVVSHIFMGLRRLSPGTLAPGTRHRRVWSSEEQSILVHLSLTSSSEIKFSVLDACRQC
jgi:hypothetical protein